MPKFTITPRGTRDIVDEEAELFEYLVSEFKSTAQLHGFKPIITPTIEFFELFSKKSGEEILRSMYVFKDKAGRELALRPEVTASVVRAYLKHFLGKPKPIHLYYIAQCFRYEEPQRGRYREFWQLGLEIIGEKDVSADINIVSTISNYLDNIRLRHSYIVGNVGIYRKVMGYLGINEKDQDHVLHLIDKEYFDQVKEYLEEKYGKRTSNIILGITKASLDDIESILRDNSFDEKTLLEINKLVNDTLYFIDLLKEIGINVEYKPSLVRGLAYYTGLIYEVKTGGLDISIGGGGRYDNLSIVYGGGKEYFTGAALGLDRIMLALKDKVDSRDKAKCIILVLSSKKEAYKLAYEIAREAITLGLSTTVIRSSKVGKALSYANKMRYKVAIIIGDRELNENVVAIKNLDTGAQVRIPPKESLKYIFKELIMNV